MTPNRIPQEIFARLIEVAKEHGVSELSITTPEGKFRIRRGTAGRTPHEAVPVPEPIKLETHEEAKQLEKAGLVKVFSPLMGVFYRSPAPGVEPFVAVGERVETGDALCIIEAMKVMNEITAEVTGTIETIVAKNGDVVEEGAVLFYMKPEKTNK